MTRRPIEDRSLPRWAAQQPRPNTVSHDLRCLQLARQEDGDKSRHSRSEVPNMATVMTTTTAVNTLCTKGQTRGLTESKVTSAGPVLAID